MHRKILILTCAALVFSGCNKSTENEVVSFDKGNLTIEDLNAHAKQLSLKKNRDNRQELTADYTFEHALNMEMLIAEGLKRNLHLDPYIRQEIHAFMSDLFLKILKQELVPEIKAENITEEEMMAYFEKHRDSYRTPDRYDISYATFKDRPMAEKALAGTWRESNGNPFFENTIRQGKMKAQSSENISRIQKETLKKLKPGEVGGVIEDSGQFWIIRLDSMTAGTPYDFGQRKAYIKNDVLYAKYRKTWEAAYEKLKKEHKVKISREGLEKFKKDFEDIKKIKVLPDGTQKPEKDKAAKTGKPA